MICDFDHEGVACRMKMCGIQADVAELRLSESRAQEERPQSSRIKIRLLKIKLLGAVTKKGFFQGCQEDTRLSRTFLDFRLCLPS